MGNGDADFIRLGDMEITSAGDIFKQCEFLRVRAGNAGLIIAQWAHDVELALASIPIVDRDRWHGLAQDSSEKRARRVARHAHRSAEAMRTVGLSAAKLPQAYLRAYQDVIQPRRQRKTFDPRAGI